MVDNMRKNFPGLTVETLKSGKQRLRVRVEGFPNRKIRINVDLDHPKFSEHYWSARAGIELEYEPASLAVRQSIKWLTDKYLLHLEKMVAAKQASPATLRQRKSLLTRLCQHKTDSDDLYGEMSLNAPTAAFVKVRDARAATPAEADNMIKAARSMYHWACDSGHAEVNPLVGIKKIHRSQGGATPWTAEDLRNFKERHPQGTMAHLALTLHMFTAARSNDAIWLGRGQEFSSHEVRWLGWQPKKRGAAYVEIPMAKPLRDAITAVARIGDAYILSEHGKPFKNADSYRNWLRKRCDEAGLKGRSSHGVRKALAELLAEEGCSEHQIMAVLSHTQPSTSAIYTKGAERRAMAAEAMKSISGFGW
ncbi:tyrosine-type recombinase/integrase [Aliiroseovarius lamellibrachiae]|uniref:tyrosine-type recombinase/integrase n=1 Tax=Aliiroseovarius lamellibrachiae TaxID=1924933 RepID=UPI001BE02B24|nr:tyrosine-type recombinase/integrase [Aliiroseovarius lamellibrachiae]MBT2130087.1 tyrosine-type recombinase/integrase [Aliiroseovarius lamellibrachiae]